MNDLLTAIYLFTPLLVGLAFHGTCMKFHWLAALARPIDANRSFRGKRLFGSNKTYRGVLAVGLGTALGFGMQTFILNFSASSRVVGLSEYSGSGVLVLGFAVGAAAMLSELPNSFIKRQLGIAPGTAGIGVVGVLFYIIDQIDLLFGAWLALSFAVAVNLERILWSAIFLFLCHQLITRIGYFLGMRATAR